ncbi:MAG TPA: GvpL/GvpF family gas vesicle protein [Streptosporangiaceae bacterium]|nr:GvpL/GvpF family gas vesicle protein [Streptosporangiaceae bacterium]
MKTVPVPQICKSRAGQARFASIRSTTAADAAAPTDTAFPVSRSEVVWVYAVTADIDLADLADLTGVAGEPVRLVTEGGLSAVVGSVSDTPFGEQTLPSLLADLSAIEKTGRAHHRVIARVAEHGPVLPLRLATVYADDETIATLLIRRYVELTIRLDSLRGTQEWDVKVYLKPRRGSDDDVWLDLGSADLASLDAARESGQAPDDISPWTALEACAEQIGSKLSRIAVATRRRPSPLPSLADDSGWIVLSSAYLVDTEHASRFSEIAASLTAAHSALRAVVTGPWPPYSFADR